MTPCPGPCGPDTRPASRPDFLRRAGGGFGLLALNSLLDRDGLLGFDHERLTCRHDGRDQRLTDVAGNVIMRALDASPDLPPTNPQPNARSTTRSSRS
jgi:hypothetical protein